MYDESRYAKKSIQMGANGYITKQEALESVTTAIEVILNGNIYVSRSIMDEIIKNVHNPKSGSNAISNVLTERELEVFVLLGRERPPGKLPMYYA